MSDISQWLQSLDLDHHSAVFVENEIDVRDLSELTEDDLKELGLTLGPRRRILAAIRDLANVAPTEQSQTSHQAERRQIAVLFCDLVGSTALSAKLDPEDMRDLMQRYQDVVSAEIVQFGGFVAKFLGDGVLACFGYPNAHEDSTERAIRAGLGIVAAISDQQAELVGTTGTCISTRIGIESGLVVVGDMIGETASEAGAIIGETPNLASRLEGVAAPGEVVIGPAARRLAGYAFQLEDRGPQILKGMTKPVRAWRVVDEAETEGRFEATRGPNLTPFVGRDAELSLLMEKWDDACAGEGRVIFVSGEAGIGKSRLTQVLRERLREVPHTRLNYQCSPYHISSALHPILRQFERAAGFAAGDDLETKLNKLETAITPGPMVAETAAPLFASMMGFPSGDRYKPLEMSPQKQKAETLRALADQVAALAETQPILLIFEDAHWVDPTSQETIEVLAARLAELRALLVITHRPEYVPPPGMQAMGHVSSIALARLGRRHAVELASHVTGNRGLSHDTLDRIVTRTDGVPLFLEELTKTVLETGAESATAIPATLNDSLMVRLDRMSPVRETAQIAACIGREFDTHLLALVSPLSDNALGEALDELVRSELIFRAGTSYVFKHALVQSAAYESLLKSNRKQIHGRIAAALEAHAESGGDAEPAVLARHCEEAEYTDRAIGYWEQAGQRSIERSANIEAIAYLRRAIGLIVALPVTFERHHLELRLQIRLAVPLISTKGYGANETGAVFERASELSEEVKDPAQLFPVLYQQWVYSQIQARTKAAKEYALNFIRVAENQERSGMRLFGHRILAVSLFYCGEFDEACRESELVLSHYREADHADLKYQFGQDPRSASLSILAHSEHLLGKPEKGYLRSLEALEHATAARHAHTLAYALRYGPVGTSILRRDYAAAETFSEQMLKLSREQDLGMWAACAEVFFAWAIAHRGHAEEAVELAERGVRNLAATHTSLDHPNIMCLLAEIYAANSRHRDAICALDDAIDHAERTGDCRYEPEAHRLRGCQLLSCDSTDGAGEAERSILRSIEIALSQSARSWELRAATSLAQLWRDQGRREEARDLLAPIYGWFTEGFGTPDLKAAKALLEELA